MVTAVAMAAGPAAALAGAGIDSAVDVALYEDGLLIGQYLSGGGAPIPGAEVRITLDDGRTTMAKTDERGAFAFRGASGAVRLTAADAEQVVRVWDHATAPPKAARGVFLVQQQTVARGQHRAPRANRLFGNSKHILANPVFIAGAAATAIAVPVALANDDDPASP